MQDLTDQCMKDVGKQLSDLGMGVQGLRQISCANCFNPKCQHSRVSGTLWERRISTQEDRLFNPLFADPSSSRYEPLVKTEWPEVKPQGWVSLNDQKDSQTTGPSFSRRNTQVPAGGIMVGGSATPTTPAADPWALPPRTLKAGATVKMGGK